MHQPDLQGASRKNPVARATRAVVAAVTALSLNAATAAVDTAPPKSAQVGHAVGATLREVGQDASAAGREIGHGAAQAGRAIGHAAKDAAVTVGRGGAELGRTVGAAARDGSKALARGLRGE